MSEAGHNSADERLKLLIERIERLDDEKRGVADDIKDVFTEAKAAGYDVKGLRAVLKLRKMTPDDRKAQQMVIETYAAALGLDLL